MTTPVPTPAGTIHVCGLASVEAIVSQMSARHLVSCLADGAPNQTPAGVLAGRHLRLVMHDIETPMPGYVEPSEQHLADLIEFVASWDRREPMLIHCFAGISRSTAAALVALCALNPGVSEPIIARRIRGASAAATPNRRIVALGDVALGRDGRLIRAAAEIGAGQVHLARPFSLPAHFSP
jgi:predicted protein tyrosine phosphatase